MRKFNFQFEFCDAQPHSVGINNEPAMKSKSSSLKAAALGGLLLSNTMQISNADEGMWLFNNPPRRQLKEKYGFEVTDPRLEHVQKSSVRFNSGGGGPVLSAGRPAPPCPPRPGARPPQNRRRTHHNR